ncbi:MAG: VWA domain-containing protein [Thermoleophilia bacterium]|nr:VWA domain-containing protein [Thermoleophilia bacterium]
MTPRRQRVSVFAAAVLAATALSTAGATRAESAAGIQLTEATESHFPDMAFVVSFPEKQPITAAQISVTENRKPVQDVSIAKPGSEEFGVVLVIDASNSMKGAPITGAIAAARAFAQRRNPGQQLALIAFNSETSVVLPLTEDAAAISTALARKPPLATGTHIHDALATAATLLADAGVSAGSIVLLSDGQDVGSTIDQATAIAGLKAARARVFAVGLRSPQFAAEALKAIAAETSGSYIEASSAAALKTVYSQLGYTLSNEYLLRYRSLAGPDEKTRVALRIQGVPGATRAVYTTPPLPTTAPTRDVSWWDKAVQSSIMFIIVILVIGSLLGYAVFRILNRPDLELTRRIGQFVTLPEDVKAKERQAGVAILMGSEGSRGSEGRWERLKTDLEIAQIGTPLRTVALVTVVAGLALGIVVSVLIGSPVGLLAAFAAPFVARSLIARKLARTRRTFSDQLPDNLDVLSSGLRSGHSFTGALAVCVTDAAEPSRTEFNRVISDEQLGVPVDEALHVVGHRMKSRDVVQIALVARLQREAGTNAADVLDQVSANVRSRLELRRLIAGLTAQGRIARWIVTLLPVGLFLAIYSLNPGYLTPLWADPIGILALIIAGIMVVIGSLIIKRIVEIEV